MITFIIFFMWADYKQGIYTSRQFLCLRTWLFLLSSGEEVSSIGHCTAHSKKFSIALGASLMLEVTNLSLSFDTALSKTAIKSFRTPLLFQHYEPIFHILHCWHLEWPICHISTVCICHFYLKLHTCPSEIKNLYLHRLNWQPSLKMKNAIFWWSRSCRRWLLIQVSSSVCGQHPTWWRSLAIL